MSKTASPTVPTIGIDTNIEAMPTSRASRSQPDQRLGAAGGVLGDEVGGRGNGPGHGDARGQSRGRLSVGHGGSLGGDRKGLDHGASEQRRTDLVARFLVRDRAGVQRDDAPSTQVSSKTGRSVPWTAAAARCSQPSSAGRPGPEG